MTITAVIATPEYATAGCPGCCSSHGGIANYCASNGRIYCHDGTVSPSCACSSCGVSPPVTPPVTPTCSGGKVWNGSACACSSGQLWATVDQICHTPKPASACGVERWSIKTGSDSAASTVSTFLSATTIDVLTSIFAPSGATSSGTRVAPIEMSTYILDGTLTDYRMTEDSDYHLVLKSSMGKTMIVEIPHPDCVSQASPFKSQIASARAAVDAAVASTTSFKTTSASVRVTGVGFWDDLHGQRGVAPNGIELHPVTAMLFNPITPLPTMPGNTVVEYYHSGLDHYFITADSSEASQIDIGSAGAWARTGETFKSGGNSPACRFYGSISPGPNSHFYTVDSDECSSLKHVQASTPDSDKRWNYETISFSSTLPVSGDCPSGTTPIYRAYNNGAVRGIDSNHRITSSKTAIQQVVTRGWFNEGVVMCAPL